jgi:Flp pilus assembly secretin CpaC
VQYQDLGLTLKATPKVMRNDDVALTIDLKIDALQGTSVNGNPVLDTRSYSGVVTLREGEGAVLISELDKQEMRAISGLPGLSEIPGLNNIAANDTQKSASTLVIVITPHVVRGTQSAGHTPMMRIDRPNTTSTGR